ncbi:MAG: hypothetical protein H0W78_05115 [Planctomycetes bacterium]|nr:hypothetical protein [Planctomycetota bacterium]
MSGLVASRRLDSWWQRLALVTWMLVVGQLAASAADITTTFVSTNVGLRIPRQAGVGANAATESTVLVSGIQTGITRVTVSLFINHRWPADLRITLIPPGGEVVDGVVLLGANLVYSTQVPITESPSTNYPAGDFYSQSNRSSFNTGIGISNQPAGRVSFSDGQAIIDQDLPAHVNNVKDNVHLLPGTYAPFQPLAAFNNMPPSQSNGTWRLYIEDIFNSADDGTLIYWSMTITEPGPHIWTGGGADDNWSTALNWVGGNVPTVGEASSLLIFPLAAAGPSINNIGEIRIVTMNVTGGYDFSATGAGSITLIANSTLSVNSTAAVDLNMPIALVGQPTVSVTGAGGLNLQGNISNDGAAAGMILSASGPLTISGTNSYTGVTTISSGVIDIASNDALGGVGGAGTTIANGASLRVAAGLILANETVSVQGTGVGGIGSLVFAGNATLGGMSLVADVPGTISVLGGGAVAVNTVTAAVTPAFHSLSITNTGTIAINGALPTTTALNLSGGATTFGVVAQPNITTLALSNGADLNIAGASATVSGTISTGASSNASTISGTTLNLAGTNKNITVAAGAAGAGGEANITNSDLAISAVLTNGSFIKRGSGVLRLSGINTGVAATVAGGTLAGAGTLASINVTSGNLSPSGAFNVAGAVNLAQGTALVLPVGASANPAIAAGGVVNLTGTSPSTGAVLQAYAGAGNTIITGSAVTGIFNGMPNNAGIIYNPTSVQLLSSGRTMAFTPPGPFVVDETVGTLVVTVTASAGGTAPVLRAFGGIIEGRDVSLVGLAPAGTYVFTIPINDNFVDTGDVTGTLAIVPQDGSLVANSATLTITDNDASDTKACGFGTGLTVFLLLGFGLFFHLRLRRP